MIEVGHCSRNSNWGRRRLRGWRRGIRPEQASLLVPSRIPILRTLLPASVFPETRILHLGLEQFSRDALLVE